MVRVKGYGQFCPIAKAAEILTERWTLLVLRDLLFLRSRHFSELRRGTPLMSPALLTKRLRTLEEQGLVSRERNANGHGWLYRPTAAAEELRPLIVFMGHWGRRWVRSTLGRDELDHGVLMWSIYRKLPKDQLPSHRVVIHLEFVDARRIKQFWLVL